jgi:hypothetical protein
MMKGNDMGFILGFVMGLLAAIGLFGFLAYRLCCGSNNVAVARLVNGIVQALDDKPKSSKPLTPCKDGEAMEGAQGTR